MLDSLGRYWLKSCWTRNISDPVYNSARAALQKLHDHKVLHGDVRNENFTVSENDEVFVIDLALSTTEFSKAKAKQEMQQLEFEMNV